ncbi:50S ribosomal protein L9 [Helicobacter pylori]|nr:50S ribosomal protein L9 [Helicobacter pylori]
MMKVLLLEDVKNLGKAGEVCEVKDGYGNNFLIANQKAKLATNEVINKYKAEVKKKAEKEALEKVQKLQMVETLQTITLTIHKKVGANGSLFGAITKEEITERLKEQHASLNLDKKDIELKHPIKSTGIYEIEVKLGSGIAGTFKIDVVAE